MTLKGFRRDLSKSDMWDIDDDERSKKLSDDLERSWQKALNK